MKQVQKLYLRNLVQRVNRLLLGWPFDRHTPYRSIIPLLCLKLFWGFAAAFDMYIWLTGASSNFGSGCVLADGCVLASTSSWLIAVTSALSDIKSNIVALSGRDGPLRSKIIWFIIAFAINFLGSSWSSRLMSSETPTCFWPSSVCWESAAKWSTTWATATNPVLWLPTAFWVGETVSETVGETVSSNHGLQTSPWLGDYGGVSTTSMMVQSISDNSSVKSRGHTTLPVSLTFFAASFP